MAVILIHVPEEIAFVENDLRRFVDAMVFKLRKNAHKGHWDEYTIAHAEKLLMGEVKELAEAVRAHNTVETMLEAADVANCALILSSIAIDRGK